MLKERYNLIIAMVFNYISIELIEFIIFKMKYIGTTYLLKSR